jgi:hypothetical protein
MRCRACDRILEDAELTKKDNYGNFLDLCGYCLDAVTRLEAEDNFFVSDSKFSLTNDDNEI